MVRIIPLTEHSSVKYPHRTMITYLPSILIVMLIVMAVLTQTLYYSISFFSLNFANTRGVDEGNGGDNGSSGSSRFSSLPSAIFDSPNDNVMSKSTVEDLI